MAHSPPYQLFLIVNSARDPRVLRVNLTAALQEEIAELFISQAGHLRSDDIEEIPFDGRYSPDADQVFFVDDYPLSEAIRVAIADPMACPAAHQSAFESQVVCGLMVARMNAHGPEAYIQAFQSSQIIRPSRLSLFMSSDTFQRMEKTGITIGAKLTAIYSGSRLFFRSFFNVRRFLDLGHQYQEATAQDLENFFANKIFDTSRLGTLRTECDQPTRRKIGFLIKSGALQNIVPSALVAVGERVSVDVELVESEGVSRIVLPGEKPKLKKLLKLLHEDYLQSFFDEDRVFETNSKRAL